MRRILRAIGATAGFTVLALLCYWHADYRPAFRVRAGRLCGVDSVLISADSQSRKFWLRLRGSSGFVADAGLLVPAKASVRQPAAILLGGKATGKHAIDYVLDNDDLFVLALDYAYDPRPSYTLGTILADAPSARRALLDMVPASRLAVDYLLQRGDVDSTRIIIVGYSFGAPFVPVIFESDPRPAVAVMVYGGGGLYSMIRHNVRRYEGPVLSELVGLLGAVLLRPLEPLRYAHRISPRPLLMINGLGDEQIPRENTEMMYRMAREPKKLVFLPSQHVRPDNVTLTRMILATLRGELHSMGIVEGRGMEKGTSGQIRWH